MAQKDAEKAAEKEAKAAAKAQKDAEPVGAVAVLRLENGRTIEFTERNFGPGYREAAEAHASELARNGIKAELL